jgi:hypothetical protein
MSSGSSRWGASSGDPRSSRGGMETADYPLCVHCGDRIGAYEPLCWRRPDGTVTTSSILRARHEPGFGTAGSVLYHRDCFSDAQPTSPWSSA